MMAENNFKMLKIQQCVVANKLPRNRPYICNICFKHFETPSKLARHYLIHTGQKPFECDVCHKTFRQLVHLERHQLTHNLPFKCSICQHHFKNLKTFVKHQQLHNETYQNDVKQVRRLLDAKQEKPVYGMYHSFTTEERWALHPHSKSDPTYSPTKKKKNIHACTICGKMFPSQSKLDRHALIHTGQRPFKCVLCNKSFRQSTHLKIHQLTHSEDRPFQCCFCQKGFKIQSKLLKHKQIHTRNKSFPTLSLKVKSAESCPLPKLNAKQDGSENGDIGETEENNQLDVHSIYIVPFQCPECEECFESEQILKGHKCFPARSGKIPSRLKRSYNYKTIVKKILAKFKHAGGKKFDNFRSEKKIFKNSFLKKCDLISDEQSSEQTQKTFMGSLGKHGTYKTAVNKRKKTLALPFSWQKHFQSQNMGKSFKGILTPENVLTMDNSVINKDISTYGSSGEEFFDNCEVLQCGFSVPSENIHTGHKICPCDKCEKVFPSVSKLQRHYLIHTGQRPFDCNVCGKSFRQSAHLKRHKLTHIDKIPYRKSLCQVEFENLNKLFVHQGDNVNYNASQQCQTLGFQKYEVSESDQISEVKAESEDFIVGPPYRNRQPYLSSVHLESEQSCHSHCCSYSGRTERNDGLLYQCSVCSKSFRSPSKLERHYLIHAGQKPFECSVCGKTFRQAPHWKRHQLTHFKE
ncbi:zinc finger protein 770 [Phacochoerus africanus]|uniref:zinc finger protein 770 n=1 Tax=Phacochoerus africanus TaxID=41426 RepID=UPI001FDA4B5A|nr:zinc finger protein 770 [Phacochoerus africanus]XP_047622737.1 zinc finger protein 770 [Phacochoerus africanus]XP_047622738.1 zinc finger protein 770 [Phacochoerus africanus]